MAVYLADDEAEVYNLTEAAVREDALTAALNLTALAAASIDELAALRNVPPERVMQTLAEGAGPQPAAQVILPVRWTTTTGP